MKKGYKIIALFFCFLCIGMCMGACTEQEETKIVSKTGTEEQKVILYLGDSIAEAVAGPSPLTERETYGYYGILGNINNYVFYNRAVSGYKTSDLLTFIQREDDGINMVKSLVSTADIIHISILGNDLLGYDISSMIVEAGDDSYVTEDARLEIAYENLGKIITTIHEMNPNAVIMMQTLYNPVGEDSPLMTTWAKNALSAKSYTAKDYHKLAGKMISRLNNLLYRYLEENTKTTISGKVEYQPFYIVDLYTAFEEIYNKNLTRWKSLFCPDGVHPANEGHAIIAEENQKKLEELSLSDKKALKRYKKIRTEQLNRLYKGIISVSPVVEDINNCTDMADVTFTYFDAIRDKTPYYAGTPTYEGNHFEEDLYFDYTSIRFGTNDITQIDLLGITIMPLSEDSYIKFGADGTFEMRIYIDEFFLTILKSIIQEYGSINISSMIGLNIDYLQSFYLQHMFPGFDYGDLDKSLSLLESTLGITVEGIDTSKECVREVASNLAKTGEIVISDKDVIGNKLGIVWKGDYRLKQVTSELTGETYTAVYINDDFFTGESFVRFTYTDNEDRDTLRSTIDVVQFVLEGEERRGVQ